jgi:hypothetical protein
MTTEENIIKFTSVLITYIKEEDLIELQIVCLKSTLSCTQQLSDSRAKQQLIWMINVMKIICKNIKKQQSMTKKPSLIIL